MEFEKLQNIIAEVLGRDAEEITGEMSFVDDLRADSLEIFQIIMGIEDTFDIILDDDVVNYIKTVGDALALISGESLRK